MTILKVNDVTKTYKTKFTNKAVEALRGVSFSVQEGEFISIMGESGSGKSTLLNCLATLDKPTSGSILLQSQDLTTINDKQSAQFRRQQLGFVFQDFNLLNTLSAKDNILLPLVLDRGLTNKTKDNLMRLTKTLNIDKIISKYPYELSGGEKQRVAIARSLITSPKLLLADEPSGALDFKTSTNLFALFQKFNSFNQTILMVTHSSLAASYSNRVLLLKDGHIVDEINRHSLSNNEFQTLINDRLLAVQEVHHVL